MIGEPSKYITVADKRFESVSVVDDGLDISLIGAPREIVEVLAYDADDERMLPFASAMLDDQGRALLNVRR